MLPFGGLTIFRENINKPILEEFIICILGPIFQIIFYLLIDNWLDIKLMHYSLLFFNLLPIIPLDGSKLLNLLLNKIFAFKISHLLTILISFIFILLGSLFITYCNPNYLLFIILFFLFLRTFKSLKDHTYIFNRFLLERRLNSVKSSKIKYVRGIFVSKMYRDYNHIFIDNNKYYLEKEIIKKKFDLQGKV